MEELDEPERVPVATANADAALLEKLCEEDVMVELATDDDDDEELLAALELLWDVEVLEVEVSDVEVDVGVVLVLVSVVLLWVVEVVLGGV